MNTSFDANIPILTEVIQAPPPAAPSPSATPANATAAASVLRQSAGSHEPHVAVALAQLSEREWEQLEHRLAERVLKQLQGRVDFVLEQRVRDSLADVLQLALVGLTAEIKRGLQQTMEEVIARAVAQEISRLQSLKK